LGIWLFSLKPRAKVYIKENKREVKRDWLLFIVWLLAIDFQLVILTKDILSLKNVMIKMFCNDEFLIIGIGSVYLDHRSIIKAKLVQNSNWKSSNFINNFKFKLPYLSFIF